jgi:hypothetical protein
MANNLITPAQLATIYSAQNLRKLPLNQKLLALYKALGAIGVRPAAQKDLSVPLLSGVGPNFIQGEGWMAVGQQTNGWGGSLQTIGSSLASFLAYKGPLSAVDIAWEVYLEFLLDLWGHVKPKTMNSPFWTAVTKIAGTGVKFTDLLATNFAWSDLLLCDHKGKSPLRKENGSYVLSQSDRLTLLDASKQAFLGNITILRPKVVVIFSASHDWILEDWLGLPSIRTSNDLRSLPECSNPNEPLLEYVKVFTWNGTLFIRSYHPGYLTRNAKKGYLKILDILAATLRNLGVTGP